MPDSSSHLPVPITRGEATQKLPSHLSTQVSALMPSSISRSHVRFAAESLRSTVLLQSAAVLTLVLGFAGPLAPSALGQDDKVYNIPELSNPPKIASSAAAAKIIQDSYPEDLRRRKVGGLVELQFVVDADGNVMPGTVEVMDATQTALGEAAKKIATRLTFEPGKLNGTKVKSKVVLPIVYKVAM
jgi:protein TonB